MKPELIFHVGYNKTGTTLLQQKLFPALHEAGQINFAGRWYRDETQGKYTPEVNELINKFTADPVSLADAQTLVDLLCGSSEKVALVSDEGMLRPFNVPRLIKNIAMLKLVASVKVLVTTRDEVDLIVSRYQHDLGVQFSSPPASAGARFKRMLGADPSIKGGWTLEEALVEESACTYPFCRHDPEKFECVCNKRAIKDISLSFYDFGRLERMFREEFGDDILFLRLIDKKDSCDEAWRALIDLLGVDISAADLDQIRNTRINSSRRPQVKVSEDVKETVRAYYAERSDSAD